MQYAHIKISPKPPTKNKLERGFNADTEEALDFALAVSDGAATSEVDAALKVLLAIAIGCLIQPFPAASKIPAYQDSAII